MKNGPRKPRQDRYFRSIAALWKGLYGAGDDPVETAEQEVVRKWLQGIS